MKKITLLTAACGVITLSMPALYGAVITLGGPLPTARTATLSSALAGAANSTTGSGNATVTEVEAFFGGNWTERADSTGPGNNGWLNIAVTTGSFGTTPAAGTWTITNAAFWTTYGSGAISLHVGNGGAAGPDHFIWKLTPGTQAGSWSYDGTGLGGGGLSNLKLYSTGSRSTTVGRVPDGGTTLVSLGVALLGLGSMRRLLAAKA